MASRYEPILPRMFRSIPQLQRLGEGWLTEMEAVARVLPFRANRYVVDELIDWDKVPEDPLFQLVFPHREMLPEWAYAAVSGLLGSGAGEEQIAALVAKVRASLNPHPGDQVSGNTPQLDGEPVHGLQHKYRETVLFFPKSGQTCHAYCGFCFRWPQFTDEPSLRIALNEDERLGRYLRAHPEVTDVLVTGGDPLTMSARRLEQCLLRITAPELQHIANIRLGTKALTFWPQRFTTDSDADALLRLLESLVKKGKSVFIMMHVDHPVELQPEPTRKAIARLLSVGAQLRGQAPVLRHINDSADVWSQLWQEEVKAGIAPYYMFVARDTGARSRYDVSLARALDIYRNAIQKVSGLARTARGPSMSTRFGKIEVQGVAEIGSERVFSLSFLQGRNPDWVKRPFFARYDEHATWFDELRPAFGAPRFFFE